MGQYKEDDTQVLSGYYIPIAGLRKSCCLQKVSLGALYIKCAPMLMDSADRYRTFQSNNQVFKLPYFKILRGKIFGVYSA